MEPTLHPGDRLLVDRAAYRAGRPSIGDLIVLEDPERAGRRLIKRVAGVGPGWFTLGRRAIRPGPEAHERPPDPEALEEVELDASQLVVISDAVDRGRDSRQFGPVGIGAVHGRAWWRYAPRERRGIL